MLCVLFGDSETLPNFSKRNFFVTGYLFCTVFIQTHPQSNANLGSIVIGSFILHRTNTEEGCIPTSEGGWRFEATDQIKQSNDENFNANRGAYTSFE